MGIVDYGATQSGVVVLALPCVILFLYSSATTYVASCPAR